jgi:hypothetical protein
MNDGPAAAQPPTAPSRTDDLTVVIPVTAVPSANRTTDDGPTVPIPRFHIDTPTALMAAVPRIKPVFVDPTGRRRLRLRFIAFFVGLSGLVFLAMVGVGFAGGPASPETILPFVESSKRPWEPPAPQPVDAVPPSTAGAESSGDSGTRPGARPTSSRQAPSARPPQPAEPSAAAAGAAG